MARFTWNARWGAVAAAAVLLTACTMKKQETPSLTGPSELGTSITVGVSPDVLTQDGASQSFVSITARDANGQPFRNVSMRAQVYLQGTAVDFGTLSARSLVTDGNGRASLVYTAPSAPGGVRTSTPIQIGITPAESDFGNATTRFVTIQLVPPGTVGLPPSTLLAEFQIPSPNAGDSAVFAATVTDASGGDATGQVTSFTWSFGDGGSASGRTATHTFSTPGSFPVSLTITDAVGRTATQTHTVTVGAGANPVAQFVASPTAIVVNQAVNFNATLSAATPGHKITDYSWNFGDGALGNGPLVSHTYTVAGSYVVVLKITDDAGRKGTTTQTITVTTDVPLAKFTFTPSAPAATAGSSASVVFDANQSLAVNGRTITSYSWDFGDGSTANGPTVSHSFLAGTTHVVVLKVTDSAGQTATTSQSVTVGVQ